MSYTRQIYLKPYYPVEFHPAPKTFWAEKKELSEVATALKNNPLLFVTGIAGIGNSEFAKHFAKKNEKNIPTSSICTTQAI